MTLAEALDQFYQAQAAALTTGSRTPEVRNRPWTRPVRSVALAVHPDQLDEARQDAQKKGFRMDWTPGGRPVFTSSRQMRDYARSCGFVHQGY